MPPHMTPFRVTQSGASGWLVLALNSKSRGPEPASMVLLSGPGDIAESGCRASKKPLCSVKRRSECELLWHAAVHNADVHVAGCTQIHRHNATR